jgi:hypothetical protein
MAYNFRTLSEGSVPFSFGFYSCHLPYTQSIFGRTEITNMDMWDSFLVTLQRHREESGLAFVIGGGDQVYVNGVDSLNIWKYLNSYLQVPLHEITRSAHVISSKRAVSRNSMLPAESILGALLQSCTLATGAGSRNQRTFMQPGLPWPTRRSRV